MCQSLLSVVLVWSSHWPMAERHWQDSLNGNIIIRVYMHTAVMNTWPVCCHITIRTKSINCNYCISSLYLRLRRNPSGWFRIPLGNVSMLHFRDLPVPIINTACQRSVWVPQPWKLKLNFMDLPVPIIITVYLISDCRDLPVPILNTVYSKMDEPLRLPMLSSYVFQSLSCLSGACWVTAAPARSCV